MASDFENKSVLHNEDISGGTRFIIRRIGRGEKRYYDLVMGESNGWSSALTWHLQALDHACALGWDWMISDSLEKVERCIENKGEPLQSEKDKIKDLEPKIPKEIIDQYRAVNALVQAAKEWKPV